MVFQSYILVHRNVHRFPIDFPQISQVFGLKYPGVPQWTVRVVTKHREGAFPGCRSGRGFGAKETYRLNVGWTTGRTFPWRIQSYGIYIYNIYANIWGICMVNVSIYGIHTDPSWDWTLELPVNWQFDVENPWKFTTASRSWNPNDFPWVFHGSFQRHTYVTFPQIHGKPHQSMATWPIDVLFPLVDWLWLIHRGVWNWPHLTTGKWWW